jgi:hypothetical protein
MRTRKPDLKKVMMMTKPSRLIKTESYLYGSIESVVDNLVGMKSNGKLVEIDYGDAKKPSISNAIIGIRAEGYQNIVAGDITRLKFIESIKYDTNRVDKMKKLNRLIKRATKVWADVKDVSEWLKEVRCK